MIDINLDLHPSFLREISLNYHAQFDRDLRTGVFPVVRAYIDEPINQGIITLAMYSAAAKPLMDKYLAHDKADSISWEDYCRNMLERFSHLI